MTAEARDVSNFQILFDSRVKCAEAAYQIELMFGQAAALVTELPLIAVDCITFEGVLFSKISVLLP